jgi:hypothetical protein
MRPHGLFAVMLCGVLGLAVAHTGAAEPAKPASVPDSWKKLVPVQFGDVFGIFVRDGYLVWMERKLDPATVDHRVQSHWYRLYRLPLDQGKVETLHAPERSLSGGPAGVLGEAGVVAWHDRGRDVRVFVPGKEPLLFSGDQPDGSHDTPLRLYRTAWLCRTRFAVESGVTLLPVEDDKPQYDKRQVIVPWQADKKENTTFEGDFFATARHAVFTKRPRNEKNYPGKPLTVLWDREAKRSVWTAPGWPIGVDRDYVYAVGRSWDVALDDVWRRPISGQGEGERLRLPWRVKVAMDFQPPKLLALFETDQGEVVGTLDLEKGTFREFDWAFDPAAGAERNPGQMLRAMAVWGHAAAGDAQTDALVVVANDAIYRVPVRERVRQLPLKWAPE